MYPNWFCQVGADRNFERLLGGLVHRESHLLQIGAFTGDASVWLMENLPLAHLDDVDTWEGSNEPDHQEFDWKDVDRTYCQRVSPWPAVRSYKRTSDQFFANTDAMYDFIYIDGGHTMSQVLRDGLNAVEHLRPGGILAFDDYTWGLSLPVRDRPHMAIEIIERMFADRLTVIEVGLQWWARWD